MGNTQMIEVLQVQMKETMKKLDLIEQELNRLLKEKNEAESKK